MSWTLLLLSGCLSGTERPTVIATPQDSSTDSAETDPSRDSAPPQDTASDSAEPTDSGSPESSLCDGRDTGTELGQCAVNFALMSREQEQVALHDFHGEVIFLDLSSFT